MSDCVLVFFVSSFECPFVCVMDDTCQTENKCKCKIIMYYCYIIRCQCPIHCLCNTIDYHFYTFILLWVLLIIWCQLLLSFIEPHRHHAHCICVPNVYEDWILMRNCMLLFSLVTTCSRTLIIEIPLHVVIEPWTIDWVVFGGVSSN